VLRASLVKHAVTSGNAGEAARVALAPRMPALVELVSDSAPSVRQHALTSLNVVMNVDYSMLCASEEVLISSMVRETVLNQNLVRTVNLGPFQFKEDDGLELRKAAYQCLISMISIAPGRLDATAVADCVVRGLGDSADVRSLANSCIISLAAQPSIHERFAASTEAVVGALRTVMSQKLKANAVRQEVEQHEDAVRACLVSAKALAGVPQVAAHPSFVAFVEDVIMSHDKQTTSTRSFTRICKQKVHQAARTAPPV